nr:DEAD/DEAH box helicase family protein [Micromonospora mirobrigensis]
MVDECHHLGAAAYEHSVKRIAAQFWLGLTATPTRRDGLGQLVTWQLGPVRHTLTDEEQGTLAAAMHTDAGPRRALFIHETTFQPGNIDLDAPARSPRSTEDSPSTSHATPRSPTMSP